MGVVDLLLLTDGRAPVGAYAHSYGLEAAVDAGEVTDVTTLAAFMGARLATTGRVDAAFTAAVHARAAAAIGGPVADLDLADDEYSARTPAPALRDASRQLGRHLLRLGRRVWPDPRLDAMAEGTASGWHQPIVLGVVYSAAGTDGHEAATAGLYGLVSGLASAGLRLLGLDPVEVHAVQASLSGRVASLARTATATARQPFAALPVTATPLLDIRAQHHTTDPAGRLFAS